MALRLKFAIFGVQLQQQFYMAAFIPEYLTSYHMYSTAPALSTVMLITSVLQKLQCSLDTWGLI